jgi:hypothetical protein
MGKKAITSVVQNNFYLGSRENAGMRGGYFQGSIMNTVTEPYRKKPLNMHELSKVAVIGKFLLPSVVQITLQLA